MVKLKSVLTSPVGNVCLSALVRLLELRSGRPNTLRALTYHRVDRESDASLLVPRLISATPDEFVRQMDLIADRCLAVSLAEVLDCIQSGSKLRPGAVLITFDDAYQCFGQHAWPVLRERSLPVVLFVPTSFPGSETQRFWWDRLHASVMTTDCDSFLHDSRTISLGTDADRARFVRTVSQQVKTCRHRDGMQLVEHICAELGDARFVNPVLSWEEIESLARQGVTIAPHTRTHPLLERVSIEDACSEACGSYDDLVDHIGSVPKVLAYPAGSHNDGIASALRDQGFEAAFTVRRGVCDLSKDNPMQLKRINVGRGTTLALLRAQLAGL